MKAHSQMSWFEKFATGVVIALLLSSGFVGDADAADGWIGYAHCAYSTTVGCSGDVVYASASEAEGACSAATQLKRDQSPIYDWDYSWTSYDASNFTPPRESYACLVRQWQPGRVGQSGFQVNAFNTFSATAVPGECPEGMEVDPVTGQCYEPQVCSDSGPFGPTLNAEGRYFHDEEGFSEWPREPICGVYTNYCRYDYSREKYFDTLDGSFLGYIQHVYAGTEGLTCEAQMGEPGPFDDGSGMQSPGQGNNCMIRFGDTFCVDDAEENDPPKNCGTVNGEYYCADDVPENGCTLFESGGAICSQGAQQPFMPDDTPIAPDAETSNTAGEPLNIYDGDTIINNGGTVTGGSNPNSGGSIGNGVGDGDGSCVGSDCGDDEGSVSGGIACDAPPVCDGDPLMCAAIYQEWRARCPDDLDASDILAAAGLESASEDAFQRGEDVDLSAALDTGGLGWSRECLPDLVISVPAFGEVVIPFSDFCWLFQLIGTLVVMSATYASYRIALGGNN